MSERSINLAELDFFTVADTAKILRLSPATIRNLIHRGKIRALKIGYGWRLFPADIQTFIEQSRFEPASKSQEN